MADSNKTKLPKGGLERPETGELGEKIRLARGERLGIESAKALRQNEMTGAGRAFRMASEFVAAIIVAMALGMAVDAIFNTRPIFMIGLLMLGFAAGVLNVTRAAAEMNAAAPKPDPDKLVPVDYDDEDDD